MYIDTHKLLNEDAETVSKIGKILNTISRLESKSKKSFSDIKEINDGLLEALKLVGYNFGILLPYYFPNFVKGKPLSLKDRPFAYHFFAPLAGQTLVIMGSRQIGKAQPLDAEIQTPTGPTKMGSLKVGDFVIGSDGKPCKVCNIFPQGERESYTVTFTDGSSVECDLEHLWKVKGAGCKNWKVETLKEIVEQHGCSPKSDNAVRIPLAQPVNFESQPHAIKPYTLGAILGDGGVSIRHRVIISSVDVEILRRLVEENPEMYLSQKSPCDYIMRPKAKYKHTEFKAALRQLKIQGCNSYNKFIPDCYKYDSVENRIDLLRGLMDTDGSIYGKCVMEFSTSSEQLASDVKWLVQSLGGTAKIKSRFPKYVVGDQKKESSHVNFRVFIKLKSINPFYVKRKAEKWYPIKYEATRILKSVEFARNVECQCIEVDSKDHTYLTDEFIVTHNTVSFSARQRLRAHAIPGLSSVYIAPMSDQIKTYSTKFREMEMSFRFPVTSYKFRQNLYLKEYQNKSKIEIVNILTDSSKIRGKSADEILFDELQNFDLEFEPEILELQNAMDLPSTIYAGTSTTKDSALEAKWETSSKGRWVMTCPSCGKDNIPTPEHNVMDMIQPDGICCTSCKTKLDVRQGKLQHEDPVALKMGIIGMHVPQVIVPFVVEHKVRYNNMFMKKLKYPEGKFYQECLGIATDDGARELTLAHIMAMCDQDKTPAYYRQKAINKEYKYIVAGCDWGGSDYDARIKTKASYTTEVILGLRPDGHVEIVHMRRFSGMEYEQIIREILFDLKTFNVDFLGTDQGVGQFYNTILRRHFPVNRHFIFQYVRQEAAELAPNSKYPGRNMYLLNRDESLSSLFYAIKKGDLSTFNWKEAGGFLDECLNIVRVPDEKIDTGKTMLRYRKHGTKPDDVLQGLNFAYAALQMVTGETVLGNQILQDVLQTNQYMQVNGYDLDSDVISM